jgi:hypothetical protein
MAQPLALHEKVYMKQSLILTILFASLVLFSGCEVVEGIFKAGVWVGVLVVVGILALILWLVSRGRR